ncbi:methyltransferase [Tsuneonella deserti]|uniref:Methyltransferase n=1 Tax=Tsuneonella deserti TaxID=2035528 RepID=A0ABQ1S8Y7_9SPHN|nr:class I SAM-dependent methyltransferase [Tsuneonella deserti]GGD95934.1 methyltransferase [Tsuneonella deserti]
MTDRSDWEGRVGQKWASEWRRTDRSFSGLTDRLLARAGAHPIQRAVDVGCGAGEVSLALARAHPDARIIGLDISEALIGAARQRGAELDNVTFLVADAGDWRGSQFAPDLVVSRHGVMFFPDPVAAFANLAQGAAANTRLVFSCFRDRTENPWATRVASLLPPHMQPEIDPDAPGPFAFADRDRVEGILTAAGWSEVAFEAVDFAYVAGAGEDALADARSFFLSIGPAAAVAATLDDAARAAFVARLDAYLAASLQDQLVALSGAAWIVSARSR